MRLSTPKWNEKGFLPPRLSSQPIEAFASPYTVSLVELVKCFSSTPERLKLIRGFLSYRKTLHEIGYVKGFQWLDGSFMENIEMLEDRPPNDIDVVTFIENSVDLSEDDQSKLDHDKLKSEFKIDSYFLELDQTPPKQIAELAAFWYGVWSHTRNDIWKGFLTIELAPDEDIEANAVLSGLEKKREQS